MVDIQDGLLPQALNLEVRTKPLQAIVVHTTGGSLTEHAVKKAGSDTDLAAIDRAARQWYETSGVEYFSGYLIGVSATIWRLAPDDRITLHTGGLGEVYADGGWRAWASPLSGDGWVKHGLPPEQLYGWWSRRWADLITPAALVTGLHPNARSIGLDLLPQPRGGYSPAQLAACADLVRWLCNHHGITPRREHILGHEDVDPCRRGTIRKDDGTVVGKPWDPGPHFPWETFITAVGAAPGTTPRTTTGPVLVEPQPGDRQPLLEVEEHRVGDEGTSTAPARDERTWIVRGRVVVAGTCEPLRGARVEAWDIAVCCSDLLGAALTDGDGHFELPLDRVRIAGANGGAAVEELYFRVWEDERLVATTESGARWRRRRRGERIHICVDRDAPPPDVRPGSAVIQGRISVASGATAGDRWIVRAFDRVQTPDGPREQVLGDAASAVDGTYRLEYVVGSGGRDLSVNLVVRVFDGHGRVIAESPTWPDAPANVHVDLVVGAARRAAESEYDALRRRVQSLLAAADLELADTADGALAVFARRLGVDSDRLLQLRDAERVGREASISPELVYAWTRQGLPGDPEALFLEHGGGAARNALDQSIRENLVSATRKEALRDGLGRLQQQIASDVAREPDAARTPLARALGTSLATPAARAELVSRVMDREGSVEDLLEELRSDGSGIAPADKDDLQLTVELAAITRDNIPLLQEMARSRQLGEGRTLRELAALSPTRWRELFDRAGATLPPGFERLGPEPYLAHVRGQLQARFPEVHLRGVLASAEAADDDAAAKDVRRIAREHPEVDILASPIRASVAAKPTLLDAVDEVRRPEVVARLLRVQRLGRLTAHGEHTLVLAQAGFQSAAHIARVPRGRFVRRLAAVLGGTSQAEELYDRARLVSTTVSQVWFAARQAMSEPGLYALSGNASRQAAQVRSQAIRALVKNKIRGPAATTPPPDAEAQDDPEWRTLFGGLEMCACGSCRSIVGPAAYLVDLLNMLDLDAGVEWNAIGGSRTLPPVIGRSPILGPLAVFQKRRPDILRLLLTCANTETTLPYIDLVNEVLEAYIELRILPQEPAASLPAVDSAEVSAPELRATPQKVRPAAYEALRTTVHPVSLPFHRSVAIARAYLAHVGTSRLEVLETFRGPAANEADRVAEALGLLPEEHAILVGGTAHPLHEFYGLASGGTAMVIATLRSVAEFLRRTETRFADLLELLRTAFLNPDQRSDELRIQVVPPEACDPAAMKLDPVTPAFVTRAHRFIRLQRRLGWTVADLDRALFALGAGDIDDQTLRRLADAKRVAAELHLPIVEVFSLWSDIDPWGPGSLYEQLFRNRTVINLEQSGGLALEYVASTDSVLYRDPSELPQPVHHGNASGPYAPTLLAAFRLTGPDLERIRDRVSPGSEPPLTLGYLSALHRHAVLARRLGVTVEDLLSLLDLSGIDPFEPHEPASTLRFLQMARNVLRSTFPVPTLDYLFRHRVAPGHPVALRDRDVEQGLDRVRTALASVSNETRVPAEPTLESLRAQLGRAFEPVVVDQLAEALDPASTLYAGGTPAVITDAPAFERLKPLADVLDEPARVALIDNGFAARGQVPAGVAPELTPAVQDQRRANITVVQRGLGPWLRLRLMPDTVTQVVADAFGLDEALTRLVLSSLLRATGLSGRFVLDELLAVIGSGLSATYSQPGGEDPSVATREPTIDFAWGDRPPTGATAGSAFSATWAGWLLPKAPGDHTLFVRATGGVWFSIDGVVLSDTLASPASTAVEIAVDVTLGSGLHEIELVQEVPSGMSNALVSFQWKTPTTPKEVIPEANLYPPGTDVAWSGAEVDWRRVHKVARIAQGFKLSARELRHLAVSSHFSEVDFSTLPVQPLDGPAPSWGLWIRLHDYTQLRRVIRRGEQDLIDIFESESSSATQCGVMLARLTGWPEADVLRVVAQLGLAADDFRSEVRLLGVSRRLDLAGRVGVTVDALHRWATEAGSPTQAADIVQAVKARYDDERWLEIATALNDPLREAQRDALVAYVLPRMSDGEGSFGTSNDLFEHLFIDVEMSACMLTSRIKQAILSVQLFIQRFLMNLEPEVDAEDISDLAEQWWWRRNYRVWEANRKILLYPENWIEPDLRLDASPFFADLEAELKQNDVTAETAERAILGYLTRVQNVARLQVAGFARDHDLGLLHVIAKTRGVPPIYYYRTWCEEEWTAWESMPSDIQGHPDTGEVSIVPVVHNRRLYVFWPLFQERADADQSDVPEGSPPKGHWAIRLAWMEYQYGKWSPKKISTGFVNSYSRWLNGTKEVTYKQAREDGLLEKVIGGFDDLQNQIVDLENKIEEFEDRVELLRKHQSRWESLAKEYGPKTVIQAILSFAPKNIPEAEALMSSLHEINGLASDTTVFQVAAEFELVANVCEHQVENEWKPSLKELENTPVSVPITEYALVGQGRHSFYTTRTLGGTLRIDVFRDEPVHQRIGWFTFDDSRFDVMGLSAVNSLKGARRPIQGDCSFNALESSSALHLLNDKKQAIGVLTKVGSFRATVEASHRVLEKTNAKVGNHTLFPFFVDTGHGYFVRPVKKHWLRFSAFDHAPIGHFVATLQASGIDGLLTTQSQIFSADTLGNVFLKTHGPTLVVDHSHLPRLGVDFERDGAYSVYNWELFFHVPFLLATHLLREHRFTESLHHLHKIFDATSGNEGGAPARFWNFLPFRLNKDYEQPVELIELLSYSGDDADLKARQEAVVDQVTVWLDHPFEPHRIARLRLAAYQKAVVMRSMDIHLELGESLFRGETMESINLAELEFIHVAQLLGPRPDEIPARGTPEPKNYLQLRAAGLSEIGNAAVEVQSGWEELENAFAPWTVSRFSSQSKVRSRAKAPLQLKPRSKGNAGPQSKGDPPILEPGTGLYFCAPPNDKLLGYWDRVEDRLSKIRNCRNIEGMERHLALFEPPIDPGILVAAVARGADVGAVLADVGAPAPHYRFTHLLQKALEFCADLKALGGALLSALASKDAEALAVLRATHERKVLEQVKEAKRRSIEEADATRVGLEKTRSVVQASYDFYANVESRNTHEESQLEELEEAQTMQDLANFSELMVAAAALTPNATLGTSGGFSSPVATLTFGGAQMAGAAQSVSRVMSWKGGYHSYRANRASILAGWARRSDDWALQKTVKSRELGQIDKQLEGAVIRVDIAKRDLETHERQIENSAAVEELLQSKFTNEDRFSWMVSQASTVYFQIYKLAFDLGRRAERAHRFERGLESSSFVQFGHWDSLKKGLLAGERLTLDLRRLEAAHLDDNRREYELTKHVSLVLHDPAALIALKREGRCIVDLPETLFDADYPGHYFRRIKSVSVTIPCVVGPYSNVNCTLTLLTSRIRTSTKAIDADDYRESPSSSDARFLYNFAAVQSVATSHAQNDSGLFDLDFRDERYLPFEGAGAISRWRIELPQESNAFDLDTVADVVFRVSYTARGGGTKLEGAARAMLVADTLVPPVGGAGLRPPLQRLISLRHEFSSTWHRFVHPTGTPARRILLIDLRDQDRFPFALRGRKLNAVELKLWIQIDGDDPVGGGTVYVPVQPSVSATAEADLPQLLESVDLAIDPWLALQVGSLPALVGGSAVTPNTRGVWGLVVEDEALPFDRLKDITLLLTFHVGA